MAALGRLSDALGASDSVAAVAASSADWVRSILGEDTIVSLARPDGSDRLRTVWTTGPLEGTRRNDVRRRVATRRTVFASLEADRLLLDDDRALAMLPLTCRGRGLGILEVLAPREQLEGAWDVLLVGASQLGVALENLSRSTRLRHRVETLERASGLGAAMVGAESAEEAVRVAIHFVWDRFRVPVAGWYGAGGRGSALVDARGLGTRRRKNLGKTMSTVPTWTALAASERAAYEQRFKRLTGVRRIAVLDGGDALLLMARPRKEDGSLEVVGELLAEMLRVLQSAAAVNTRNEQIDLGIAWTAHELRGPLLGIRAALEVILSRRPSDETERSVLSTSLQELDRLAGSAEAILSWASGAGAPQLDRNDLVTIVDDVVAASHLEAEEDRPIMVSAPETAIARFDPDLIRMVASNLVRNAVAYSYRGTKIQIEVEQDGDHIVLRISDEGPDIPIEERESIFEPFVRGRTGASRLGSGLGLFIAKRAVDVHGGRIGVESERGETTFSVRLPVRGEGVRASAS